MENEVRATLLAHDVVLRALARFISKDPAPFMAERLQAAKRELQDEGVASTLPDDVLQQSMRQVLEIAAKIGWRAKVLGDLPPGDPSPQSGPQSA